MTTMLNLEEIDARVHAATPGPWLPTAPCGGVIAPNGPDPRGDKEYYGAQLVTESSTNDDRIFIAHAREDVPALVAEVRRLRDEIGLGSRDQSGAPELTRDGRWTLRQVAEQAVTLYEILRDQADKDGDVQAENFWEGHRNTAMHTLGRLQEAERLVDGLLGEIPNTLGRKPADDSTNQEVTHGAAGERPGLGEQKEAERADEATVKAAGRAEIHQSPRASGTPATTKGTEP